MNNENEERALIKKLKILDGKLNIKLEWPKQVDIPKILLINEVVISKHLRASPGSLLMMTVLTRVEHMGDMPFLLNFFNWGKK